MNLATIASPCIGLCLIDETQGHCLGCGRTRGEIGRWLACTDDERRAVVRAAAIRLGHASRRDGEGSET
jgi:predicted Fe-S protein YdhL (DUF1289 family)